MSKDKTPFISNDAPDGVEDWFNEPKKNEKPDDKKSGWFPPADKGKESSWRSWQVSVAIACVILGILVSLLVKTNIKNGGGESNTIYGQSRYLAEMVKYLQNDRNKILADLSKTRKSLETYEKSTSKGSGESAALKHSLALAKQEAGLTAVHGPGITVQLNDSVRKLKSGDDPNLYIVHDIDLIALINELWASGAEAVSINEQRIVMTTAIRCVGPTITVNTVRLAPPYAVKAIGPPSSLETGLRYTGGFLDNMSPNIDRGVEIKISRDKELIIPQFEGSLVNRYAKPYSKGK